MKDDKDFPKASSWQSFLRTLITSIATLIVALPTFATAVRESADPCLALEGKNPIVVKESTSRYERKLFVTPDEVARYVFLTNRYDDGDRSAAVYRARRNKGSLSGDHWVTATVAADSVRGANRNVRVRRYDAPLPARAANVLHELWLTVLEQRRPNEDAIPIAPTGILYVTTGSGARLKGVTAAGPTALQDKNSLCDGLINIGELLIDYAKLPASTRAAAAQKIEQNARTLLQRVNRRQ